MMENKPGLSGAFDWTNATPEERLAGLYSGDPVADYAGYPEIQKAIIADEMTAQTRNGLAKLEPSEGATDNSRRVLIKIVRPERGNPTVNPGGV